MSCAFNSQDIHLNAKFVNKLTATNKLACSIQMFYSFLKICGVTACVMGSPSEMNQ